MTDLEREDVEAFVQASRAMVPAVREMLGALRDRATWRAASRSAPTLDSLIEFLESIPAHAETAETIGREMLARMVSDEAAGGKHGRFGVLSGMAGFATSSNDSWMSDDERLVARRIKERLIGLGRYDREADTSIVVRKHTRAA